MAWERTRSAGHGGRPGTGPPCRAWPARRARRRQLTPPRQAGPAGYAAGTLAMYGESAGTAHAIPVGITLDVSAY
jgi:hypothetical protein